MSLKECLRQVGYSAGTAHNPGQNRLNAGDLVELYRWLHPRIDPARIVECATEAGIETVEDRDAPATARVSAARMLLRVAERLEDG